MSNETALVSHQFTIDAAIMEWLAQKERRTSSQKTRRAYLDTIQQFRAFLAAGQLDLLSNPIDIARLAALWANMRAGSSRQPGAEVSPSTFNQRLAVLSSWYTFVQETYHLDIANPIKDVKKRPVQAYAAAEPIAPEVVEEGIEDIDRRTPRGLRDYALLAVALSTGRRASELVGLRGQDVKIQGAGRRTKDARVTLTFHCKGSKVMRDRLDEETSAVFLEYLHAQHGKQILILEPDAPIWVSYSNQNRGQAISTQALSDICEKYLETSKVHALRHTFSVGMVRSGAPITDLAGRLGHTDIKITQIYTKEIMGDENPYAEKLSARFGIKRKTAK
jgi:site-specific recombinase XerD